MTFGERVASLRKKKKLSQGELGKLVGIDGDALGRYERDEVKPSIEMANKIAHALEVSLDYLVGNTELELDKATLKRIQQISKLSEEDKEKVYFLLDALLRDFKARKAYS